ncbi:MAG: pilus assembly protein [Hyphomonadaceae bacterium]|nr:pilus assembly protein [Hyphomonadaceae bacterium]
MWRLRRHRRRGEDDAIASIEFGFIAPVLAFAIMGLVDVGMYIHARSDMTSSVKSGVDYFLMGGQDSDTAIAVIDHAWTRRPEHSTIETERFCTCGEIVAVCTNVCPDGTQPDAFKKIVVAAYYDGLLIQKRYYSDETVRIR